MKDLIQSKEQKEMVYGFFMGVGLSLCFVVLALLALLNDGRAHVPAATVKIKLPYHYVMVHKHKLQSKYFHGSAREQRILAHVNIVDKHTHKKTKSLTFAYGLHSLWWSNGSLRLRERYCERATFLRGECVLGRLHGISRSWFPNGNLRWKKFYHNGVKVGTHRTWYMHGKSKLRSEVTYVKGQKQGLFRMWRWDGNPSEAGLFQKGQKHGLWKRWYPNGKLMEITSYRDGKRHGVWKQWFWICRDNGCFHLKFREGTYKDGKKHGRWLLWNVNNGTFTAQQWQNGTLL